MIVPDIHAAQQERSQIPPPAAPVFSPINPSPAIPNLGGMGASRVLIDPFADVKPTAASATVESIEVRVAATIPEDLDNAPLVLFGKPCRRITLASMSLLYQVNSFFGVGGSLGDRNPFMEVGKFLALQSGSLKASRKLARDAEALEALAYEILDSIEGLDATAAVTVLIEEVKRATETQVRAELPPDQVKQPSLAEIAAVGKAMEGSGPGNE